MKNLLIVTLVALFVLGCKKDAKIIVDPPPPEEDKLKMVIIVPGISSNYSPDTIRYEYDDQGRCTKRAGIHKTSTFIYEEGRITEKVTNSFNSVLMLSITYYMGGENHPDSAVGHRYEYDTAISKHSYSYEYDGGNTLTRITQVYHYYSNTDTDTFTTNYTYTDGNPVKMVQTITNPDIPVFTVLQQFDLSKANTITEPRSLPYPPEGKNLITKYETQTTSPNSQGQVYQYEYTFDASGRVLTQEDQNHGGKLLFSYY